MSRWSSGGLLALASVATALVLWTGAAAVLGLPDLLLPSPVAVAAAFGANAHSIAASVAYTAAEVAVGWTIGVTVGVALAAAIALSPAASRLGYPFLVVVRLVPVVVFLPVLVLVLGPTAASRAAIAVLVTFFPVTLATIEGLRSTDGDRLATLSVVGASRWQQLRYVRLPDALPALFTGLTVSAPIAVQTVVLAEFLVGNRGIGAALQATAARFETALLFAYVLVLIGLGIALFGLLRTVESAVRWDAAAAGVADGGGTVTADLPGNPATNAVVAAATFGVGALVWQVASGAFPRDLALFLPAPLAVGRTLLDAAGLFVGAGTATLLTFTIGWGGGSLLGLAVGAVVGLAPRLRGLLGSHVVAARSVPDVAVVPLFLVWFRVGPTTAALLVAVAAVFPVALAAADGAGRLPARQYDLLRSVGAPRHRVLVARARYALPQLFAGLKLSVVGGFTATVIAEWFLTSDGLGVLLLQGMTDTNPELTYAAALALAALGMALYGVVAGVQRRLTW
ncbi:ABC transporter permease [Halolamina litorea]|uniref:ABC transporter permease n=1 Tax=Halolamina litorea TaxID=1515593 RepID=UPI00226F4657|nr:ABC transporter permease subunit [Halolamina litorea]